MKPGPKGLEAIKEAIIAQVPRSRLDDPAFDLEDWIIEQLLNHMWIQFNMEKAVDVNAFYRLKDEIVRHFK